MQSERYCAVPDEGESGWDQRCPACGATIEGGDPVRGGCQALLNRPAPRPILFFQLIDKETGAVVLCSQGADCRWRRW
jgi:hypothetical protein